MDAAKNYKIKYVHVFSGEFYQRPRLSCGSLLPLWHWLPAPLPHRDVVHLTWTEGGWWMPSLPPRTVLWPACNSRTLPRSPMPRWVNTSILFIMFTWLFEVVKEIVLTCTNLNLSLLVFFFPAFSVSRLIFGFMCRIYIYIYRYRLYIYKLINWERAGSPRQVSKLWQGWNIYT